jgi:hypothetical protein
MIFLLRLLIWSFIFYLIYKLFRDLISKGHRENEIKGKAKSKPLDLSDMDVEDAQFEDIDNQEN